MRSDKKNKFSLLIVIMIKAKPLLCEKLLVGISGETTQKICRHNLSFFAAFYALANSNKAQQELCFFLKHIELQICWILPIPEDKRLLFELSDHDKQREDLLSMFAVIPRKWNVRQSELKVKWTEENVELRWQSLTTFRQMKADYRTFSRFDNVAWNVIVSLNWIT